MGCRKIRVRWPVSSLHFFQLVVCMFVTFLFHLVSAVLLCCCLFTFMCYICSKGLFGPPPSERSFGVYAAPPPPPFARTLLQASLFPDTLLRSRSVFDIPSQIHSLACASCNSSIRNSWTWRWDIRQPSSEKQELSFDSLHTLPDMSSGRGPLECCHFYKVPWRYHCMPSQDRS